MKEGWEYKKLEDALLKVKYTKKIQNSDYLPNGVVPVVSQEESFISGYWNNMDDAFKVDSPVVIFGDHSRVVKYVDFDFVLGADGVKILKPIDELNARFFYHFLKWYNVPSLGYSRHYKLLKEIEVPIPSLSDQQHIVEELDLLSSIIEKKKAQLNELDNLAQSFFYEMFGDPVTNEKGWEVKKIGAICSSVNNIKWETVSEEDSFTYIDLSAVDRNERCIKDTILICKNDAPSRAKQIVKTNDVIFGTTRPMLKRVCTIKSEYDESICSTGFCVLRPKQDIIKSEMVYYYLQTSSFYSYIEPLQSGANYPAVSDKIVKSFTIPIPPMALQQEFASKIEAIEHQKELIKQSIKEVETLFNSRMDYYFN